MIRRGDVVRHQSIEGADPLKLHLDDCLKSALELP
jgi:hypothetical protein